MSLHFGPDGDSLGSCTAMKYVLERDFGIKISLVSKDEMDETLMRLRFSKEVKFGRGLDDMSLKDFDAVLFLDTGSVEMSLKKKSLVKEVEAFTINIDHHATNNFFGKLNYIDTNKSSACSILLDFFESLNIKFDPELAQRLLLGVCTDSGFFSNVNAESALRDAYLLIKKGANYLEIMRSILSNQPLRLKKYHSLLINNLRVNKEKRFCYSVISNADVLALGLNKSEVRLGIKEIQTISGFDFVFTLVDLGSEIKRSFRSDHGIDISFFTKALGGGGHRAAGGGFSLPKIPLVEAEKRVLEVIEKVGVHKI